MLETIDTGHRVRPRLTAEQVLLGWLTVLTVSALAAFTINRGLFAPLLISLTALGVGLAKYRIARHRRQVAADIQTRHGITVPEAALTLLLHERDAVFTDGGQRYRLEPSVVPGPENNWEQPTVVLVPMGADAATLFGPR